MSRGSGNVSDMEEIQSSVAAKAPGEIFERVFRGETILLTRYGRPYVMLSPPPERKKTTKTTKG